MGLENILKRELEKQDTGREMISVILESSKVSELDNIVKEFERINPNKRFTRERLIEIAIDNLIDESKKVINECDMVEPDSSNDMENHIEYDMIDNTEYNMKCRSVEFEGVFDIGMFDTVIFPAQSEGFKEIFLKEKKWYYVRLGKDKLDKIKYVACYVGTPVSAITHYAKVGRIEEVMVEEKKKYVIYFDGEAIPLERKIPIGNAPTRSMRANRYVMLEQLFNEKSY